MVIGLVTVVKVTKIFLVTTRRSERKGLMKMERIRILVPTEPVPLARVRFSGRHCYQPKRNREYRAVVQQAARSAMGNLPPLQGEIAATVKLYRRYKPTARNYGDCDNHLKALLDALNGTAFEDDRQIVRCLVEKFTDKGNPRTEIELETFSTQV